LAPLQFVEATPSQWVVAIGRVTEQMLIDLDGNKPDTSKITKFIRQQDPAGRANILTLAKISIEAEFEEMLNYSKILGFSGRKAVRVTRKVLAEKYRRIDVNRESDFFFLSTVLSNEWKTG